jgi:hypothetical protein
MILSRIFNRPGSLHLATSRVAFTAGLILSLVAARPLAAQFSVVGTRDLAFGSVIPGVTTLVGPMDPVRSGVFDITANQGTRLRLDFTLPTRLVSGGGAQLTINFANGDAILLETGPGSIPNSQNPKSMKPYTMTNGNRVLLYLGGNVTPTGTQATGVYTASVMLTVTIL